MIVYFPELYPEETLYSLFCRYYVHNGYPFYVMAMEDLLVNRYSRLNIEFIGKLKPEIWEFLARLYGIRELVEQHTMFPQYALFSYGWQKEEAVQALETGIINGQGAFKARGNMKEVRTFRFCPLCVKEDRHIYGEAYWHREWFLRGVDVCAKHRCRLVSSGVFISDRSSPRLYPAEECIPKESEIHIVEGLEQEFTEYVLQVFHSPFNPQNQVHIKDFLISNVEGTKYISARGEAKSIRIMFDDIFGTFRGLSENRITEIWQLQKVFSGHNTNFMEICQIAYFLGISSQDLTNPILPSRKQIYRYEKKVMEMHEQGFGCYRIARVVGGSPTNVQKTIRKMKANR